jgi:hypothetical protein
MKKLITSLKWLDEHILKILVIGFIFIIPLYPKLPLKMIEYTYVAFRLEDIYLAFVGLIFGIQFLRRKVHVSKKFAILIGIYWIAVFASYWYGFYVQESVRVNNIGLLHSLRRIEYMLIFFVAYTTIKSKKDFFLYFKLIFSVAAIVSVYGIGQKFLGWPAVQTMNPEYAKGYILVLDSWARISSTFAGHYDLSAYLLLLIPIILGFYIGTNKKIYLALFFLTLITLVLAASRASYLSYIGAVTLFLLYTRNLKLLFIVILATAILTPLSDNLANRLTRTFQQTKIFIDPVTGEAIIPKDSRPDDLPPGNFGANVDTSDLSKIKATEVDAATVQKAKKEIRETLVAEGKNKGRIYTETELEALIDEEFLRQIPINKYLIDISISNRFQVSWPRALNGLKFNPILGLGPSSLGEATDGDYFRWLGETGLFGTIAFLAIFFEIVRSIWRKIPHMLKKDQYIYLGFLFGFLGLFVNASYIDVFEASKVAYTFWLLSGICIAALPFFTQQSEKKHLKNDSK